MNWKDGLPFELIGRRFYLRRKLEQEGKRMFACLETEFAKQQIRQFAPIMKARVITDQYFLVKLAYWLGFQGAPRRRILDIGSRHGLWPFLCRAYGHDAVCADLEEVLALDEVRTMNQFFGNRVQTLRVEPLQPLGDIGGPYDCITGLRTRFHSLKADQSGCGVEVHWGLDEWQFFLKDITKHIQPGGQIFFLLNRLQEKEKGGDMPREMQKHFRAMGAVCEGMCLWFKNVEPLRS
jgi:SAM-dependent methyltransferase